MKYLIGTLVTPFAVGLIYNAWRHRSRFQAARADAIRKGRPAEHPIAPDSLAALGEILAPLTLMILAFIAIKLVVSYAVLESDAMLSPFDLGGTLFLILAYGVWLKTKTSMRIPEDDEQRSHQSADVSSMPGALIFDGKTAQPQSWRAAVNSLKPNAGARVSIQTGPRHGTAVAHDTQPNFEQE